MGHTEEKDIRNTKEESTPKLLYEAKDIYGLKPDIKIFDNGYVEYTIGDHTHKGHITLVVHDAHRYKQTEDYKESVIIIPVQS